MADEDLPATITALGTLTDQISAVTSHVQRLLTQVRSGSYLTPQGVSFLEVKNQLLLSYLIDLTHVITLKSAGLSLLGQASILRLTEIRTVLEKMRPIDQKLKYQLHKLITTAATGSLDDNNPLSFKPNPHNLLSKLEDDEGGEGGEGKMASTTVTKPNRKYIPPRIAPAHYEEAVGGEGRGVREAERARRRALSSSVIRELRDELADTPHEIREDRDFHTHSHSHQDTHRVQYEELMLQRVSVGKRDHRGGGRGLGMSSQLRSLTHFGSIRALTGETEGEGEDTGSARKKRKIIKKKGFKKGFRGRRRR